MVGTKTSAARAPFVLIPQAFGSLVFERRTGRYLPFDAEATGLFLTLADETVDAVMDRTRQQPERTRLARFYEEFYALGFFSLEGNFIGEVLTIVPPATHLAGPLAVHLEISDGCNLKCRHCFAGEFPHGGRQLQLAELDRLFAQMACVGSYRLGLTGGEPLLREDLFEVIDLALAHGLSPCVTTNGMLLNERIAREFGRRELLWLNVSLEGSSPATNDPIRGEGSFERVIQNLKILSSHARFSLAFTVLRTNLHEISKCAELAQVAGAESAVFRPLYPVGSARKRLDLMPSFAEYNAALKSLSEWGCERADQNCPVRAFSPAGRQPLAYQLYRNHGCGAGSTVCSISNTGDLNPCSLLGPCFQVGNVRDHSFSELWRYASLEQFGRQSKRGGQGLDEGCRARALWFNGSVYASDPWITDGANP